MSTHKFFNGIAVCGMAVAVILTVLLNLNTSEHSQRLGRTMGYEERLFDTSRVHTIDIQIEDWEGFLDRIMQEEYSSCTLVVDGEAYANVGIRGKGNTSLTSVQSMGSDRYSFKVEFDQYQDGNSYYGLDKLCLNNLYADNTYMKDYLCYTMMQDMGVPSPLCSYVYLTVNGEDWGLYLAAEGVEESFLQRNYGNDYGKLYKPDTDQMGRRDMGMSSADVKLQYIDEEADSYSNIFENAKTKVTDEDKERLIRSLENLNNQENLNQIVDVEGVIKYFAVHNFVCNDDSYTGSMVHNYYLYEDEGRLSMIPWDYNLAFGGFSQMQKGTEGRESADGMEDRSASRATAEVNSPIDSPVEGGNIFDRPMVAWIFDGGEYEELYHNYYTLFLKENFSDGSLEKEILRVQQLIAPYVKKDPTAFGSSEDFEVAVEVLKEFLTLRAKSVIGQLAGSIPSTSEGQLQDAASLIQAEDLDLTLLGEMHMGGGAKAPGRGEERPLDDRQRPADDWMPPEGGAMPEGGQMPPEGGTMPEGGRVPMENGRPGQE